MTMSENSDIPTRTRAAFLKEMGLNGPARGTHRGAPRLVRLVFQAVLDHREGDVELWACRGIALQPGQAAEDDLGLPEFPAAEEPFGVKERLPDPLASQRGGAVGLALGQIVESRPGLF